MAKPTGAIEPGNLGYWVQIPYEDTYEYVYIGWKLEQAIRHWRPFNRAYVRYRFKSCVTVAAGETLYIYYGSGNANSFETRVGALTAAWSAAWTEWGYTSIENDNNTSPPESNPHADSEGENLYGHIRPIRITNDPTNRSPAIVHSIAVDAWVETPYDNAPGDPPPAARDHVEMIDRSGGADCIYRRYTTLSAWHGMQIAAANLNVTSYQAHLLFSIPLFKGEVPS